MNSASFIVDMNAHFAVWRETSAATLKELQAGCSPREIISQLSESLLAHYADKPLIDPYDVYQHLMDYWAETMQDDCYCVASEGWKAETHRVIETDKKGKEKDKGWVCDLIPKALIVARYFAKEQAAIDQVVLALDSVTARLTELEEEHGGEDGAYAEFDKVNKTRRHLQVEGDQGRPGCRGRRGRAERLVEAQQSGGQSQELSQGSRSYERWSGLRPVSEAHRVRGQDARGGRQVARHSGCGHLWRDGLCEPATRPAREGSRRALRDPACRRCWAVWSRWKPR